MRHGRRRRAAELERTAVATEPDREGVTMSRSPMMPLPSIAAANSH
jgi:hypothetical protein